MLLLFFSSLLNAQSHIRYIDIQGLKGSDRDWFQSLVGVVPPCALSQDDLKMMRNRMLASGVFSYVQVNVKDDTLYINVEEKWTLIPVIRAKSGGGTPLVVIGAYESNFLGREWVLGGEMRRYGGAPIGGLFYTQLPNLIGQKTLVAAELGRISRVREFYDSKQEFIGNLQTEEQKNQLLIFTPAPFFEPSLRYGVNLRFFKLHLGRNGGVPEVEDFRSENQEYKTLAVVDYDTLVLDNLVYNGIRSKNRFGLIFGSKNKKQYSVAELEIFYYKTFFEKLGLALHGFFAESGSKALQAQYFLGGFDSVRGIPDGAIWGNKAWYSNTELLYLFFKSHYLWLQSSMFFDYGQAAQRWEDLKDSRRTSFGAGLRLAVPQIYRLVLRFDFAWNVETGSKGLSLGFNQFFQPYTPSLSP